MGLRYYDCTILSSTKKGENDDTHGSNERKEKERGRDLLGSQPVIVNFLFDQCHC